MDQLKRLLNEAKAVKEAGRVPPGQIAKVEHIIKDNWTRSSDDEAKLMIEIMSLTPSTFWFEMMAKAEAKQIAHWQLLLEEGSHIYESAAEAVANDDGLVVVKNERG